MLIKKIIQIILSDNVLWHGKLFNNIENYDFPKTIRDGLSLSFVKI
ncbi:MAG: hypothetical protein ACE19P_00050 [Candidatus Karelsulcia muelleri]